MVVVLLSVIFFAALQFCMVTMLWLRADEAAFSAVRCAVVAGGARHSGRRPENPLTAARTAVHYLLDTGAPAVVTLYEKIPLKAAGTDRSGEAVKTFAVHAYYYQKLSFSPVLQRDSLGTGHLEVSRRYGPSGAAHCRMIRSPDRRCFDRPYPGGRRFDE